MKKLLGLIIALIIPCQAFASIAVAPTKIEINANKMKTNYATASIEIKGDNKKPMRFKVYPEYFTINQKSELISVPKSDDVHNLSKKLRFVPAEFTVMQGKSQKVRINIPNLNQLPDGESRCVLYIEDVNPKELNLETGHVGIGAQLIVKTRIGVPVYVDKGKVVKDGDIETLEVVKGKDGLYTKMKLVATGNSKIRFTAKGQIIQGKKLVKEYSMAGAVVADNNFYIAKDKIETAGIKESGEYILRVVVSFIDENGKRKNIKKETTINI